MKTLQIVGNTAYGGGINIVLEWCKYLLEKNCQVDVLATNERVVAALNEVSGIRVVQDILIPRQISPLTDSQVLWRLVRRIRSERYDVVHTYTATPGFLGRVAARLAGTPVIFHHQASWMVTELTPLITRMIYTPLEYLSALASTRGICVAHAIPVLAQKFHTAPANKLVVVCNGIDPAPFLEAERESARRALCSQYAIPWDAHIIGSTNRLARDKDMDSLLRAIPSLKHEVPNEKFALVLAGDGTEQSALEALAADLGIADHTYFLGFQKDVVSLLAAFDYFVTPTLREGLSVSLLEAMAAAKPIVATSILPNVELIEHEITGLTVEIKSPQQIAHALARFVQEPVLAMQCAATARQRLLDHYTLDRMLNETWDQYEHWLAHTGRKQKLTRERI